MAIKADQLKEAFKSKIKSMARREFEDKIDAAIENVFGDGQTAPEINVEHKFHLPAETVGFIRKMLE